MSEKDYGNLVKFILHHAIFDSLLVCVYIKVYWDFYMLFEIMSRNKNDNQFLYWNTNKMYLLIVINFLFFVSMTEASVTVIHR